MPSNEEAMAEGFEIVEDKLEITNATLERFSGVFSSINGALASQTTILSEMLALNSDALAYQKQRDQLESVGNSIIPPAPVVGAGVGNAPGAKSADQRQPLSFGADMLSNFFGSMLGGISGAGLMKGAGKLLLRGGVVLMLHEWASKFVGDFLDEVIDGHLPDMSDSTQEFITDTGERITTGAMIGWAVAGRKGAIIGAMQGMVSGLITKALDHNGVTKEELDQAVAFEIGGFEVDSDMMKEGVALGLAGLGVKFGPALMAGLARGIGAAIMGFLGVAGIAPTVIALVAGTVAFLGKKWLDSRKAAMLDDVQKQLDMQAGALDPNNEIGFLGRMANRLTIGTTEEGSDTLHTLAASVGAASDDLSAETPEAAQTRADLKTSMDNRLERAGIDPNDISTMTPDKVGSVDLDSIRRIYEGIGDSVTAKKIQDALDLRDLQEQYKAFDLLRGGTVDPNGVAYDQLRGDYDMYTDRLDELGGQIRSLGGIPGQDTIPSPGAQPSAADIVPRPRAAEAVRVVERVAVETAAAAAGGGGLIVAPTTNNIAGPTTHGGTRVQNNNTTYIVNGPGNRSDFGGPVN